jgi:CO dehydrogenase maturation factor
VDTLPGLSFSLGLGRVGDAGLPADLAERREKVGWVLREPVSAEDLVERHAMRGPDGVRLLQLGKLPGNVKPGSTVAFRHVLETFRRPGWSVIVDLAAGTRQSSGGWARFTSAVALVVEPSRVSFMSARRLRAFADPAARLGLVINKVRAGQDLATKQLAGELQLPVWAEVPYDEELAAADRRGLAPIDAAPSSPAMSAIAQLFARLKQEGAG